jgi:integrase
MARNISSNVLETRTLRSKLIPRRKPYSIRIAPGIRLAYRRNEGAGTWNVLCADGAGGSWLKRIAIADDHEDADGKTIMDFWQAIEAARKLARATDGVNDNERPATVREAFETYRCDLVARDGNEANATVVLNHISPGLAARPVSMLTLKEIRAFRDGLIATGITKASVNRYIKSLVACLNLAARLDDRVTNMKAWKISALPDATEDRNVILTDDQVRTVIPAAYEAEHAFGLLVETLAVTGTRVSQAARLAVGDLLPDRLMMPPSRKGSRKKPAEKRPIPVPLSLAAKLRTAAGDRPAHARLLLRSDNKPWGRCAHARPFQRAAKAAGLDPKVVTIYALRHSSIVRQLLAGVPTRVVAAHHDTSVPQIEKHYSKHILDYTDAMTRRALLDLDQGHPALGNVVPMLR